MELAVLIAAVVGIVLFALSYLKFAYEGFRYHVITGFLALIPVINLIALPTLWDRTYRMLIVGIVGLAIAAGAWFAGADNTFWGYWNRSHKQAASPALSAGNNANNAAPNAGTASGTSNTQADDNTYSSLLPSKALYRLDFETASPDQIKAFVGRIVRITNSEHEVTVGRIQSVTPASVFIERTGSAQIAYEMVLSNIKTVEVMVKREAR